MKFPSITDVSRALRRINKDFDGQKEHGCDEPSIDVRLCVYSDGSWKIRWGLVDYDPDHAPMCGASSVPGSNRRFNSRETAKDLIEQCKEMHDDPDDEPSEPGEGDYTTSDHISWYQYGKLVLTTPIDSDHVAALHEHMRAQNFYPSAWFVSDHGNAILIAL